MTLFQGIIVLIVGMLTISKIDDIVKIPIINSVLTTLFGKKNNISLYLLLLVIIGLIIFI
jgi:hypothetical protein